MHMQNNGRNDKNKTLQRLKRIVKLYDKPEYILNIIVIKFFLLKLSLTKGSVKSCPLLCNLTAPSSTDVSSSLQVQTQYLNCKTEDLPCRTSSL